MNSKVELTLDEATGFGFLDYDFATNLALNDFRTLTVYIFGDKASEIGFATRFTAKKKKILRENLIVRILTESSDHCEVVSLKNKGRTRQ